MPPPARPRRVASPSPRRRDRQPPRLDDDEPTLQLAIGRDGIGLELSGAVDFGAARLLAARAKLVGVRFPLDVTGGVERFRHRRTSLELATIAIEHAATERWLASQAHDLLARGAVDARIGIVARRDDEGERRGDLRVELASIEDAAIAAFDVTLGAHGGGMVLFAHRPRGASLSTPVLAIAGRLFSRLATALGGRARGVRLDLADPSRLAVVAAFVARGARVPTRDAVVVTKIDPRGEGAPESGTWWTVSMERAATPASPSSRFASLAELDRLASEGDVALVEGSSERARELYLRALERAPRHKAILMRLAELDAATAERPEAALTWLREAQRARGATSQDRDDNELGRTMLGASLHARTGATGRARAAFDRSGQWALEDGEPRLAARCFAHAASTYEDLPLGDARKALEALLDRALSADPSETSSRWRRARLRIEAGDDEGALEDVQHLEAQTHAREGRRAMLLRAASMWGAAGRNDRAVPAYERALRYAPDDRLIVAGLGSALVSAGEAPRGAALIARALSLPGDEASHDALVLDLARALADRLGDLPAAIARLAEVARASPRAPLASLLEATYRARLGDRVGATRALSAAADLCERRGVPASDSEEARAMLSEAAIAARDEGDAAVAMRLALAAIALAPHDDAARALVRSIGSRSGELDDERSEEDDEGEQPAAPDAPGLAALSLEAEEEPRGSGEDEARAEALLARVKADPGDEPAIEALIELLSRLGRDLELFALLSARLDEASDEERPRLIPRQRATLERLASLAEAHGRRVEASLYRDAARALEGRST